MVKQEKELIRVFLNRSQEDLKTRGRKINSTVVVIIVNNGNKMLTLVQSKLIASEMLL